MSSLAPPTIPGLERPEVLGRGGYGTVYAVDEPEFGRRVALKVLADRLDGDDVRRAFTRECQAMGALSGHPHIVTVHRGGSAATGEPFIVMDLLSGGSLGDRLARTGPLPWAETVEIGVVLAGALETAHRAGILHLDVKPANVLVSRFGDAVLSDFGISRLPGVTSTLDGRVRASAAYAAPERLLEGGATVAVDLYGLGATLFALLNGRPAFVGDAPEDLVTTVARVLRDPLPDLRLRGVPGPVATLVERLMDREPHRRFASAAEVAAALQDVQRVLGEPVTRAVIEGTAPVHGGAIWPPAPDGSAPTAAAPGPPAVSTAPPTRTMQHPSRPPAATGLPGAGAAVGAPRAGTTPSSAPPGAAPPSVPARAPATGHRAGATPPPGPPPQMPAHLSAPTLVGMPLPGAASAPDRRPPPRRRGPLIAVMVAALVVGFAVTGGVLLLMRPSAGSTAPPSATVPTPVPASLTAAPATSAAPAGGAVLAGGVGGPTAVAAQKLLSTYVTAIDERRYADAFALFSPDSQTVKGGLPAWQKGQSTTRITGARILAVTDVGRDATAEMTFTSTQSAQYGPNGQTCTRWDLVYTLAGPAPDLLIRGAKSATPPRAC